MSLRPLDPRKVRTRQMLREALIVLILEQGYDSISIQDITDKAGLRRATFYLHYRHKEELLLSMMRQTVDELMLKMQESAIDLFGNDGQLAETRIIFEHVKERANLYRAILSGQGAAQVTRDVRVYMAARIRERCLAERGNANLPVPIEVVANYLAAVKLNMIIWWLEKDMPYTTDEMANMVTKLSQNGVGALWEMAA